MNKIVNLGESYRFIPLIIIIVGDVIVGIVDYGVFGAIVMVIAVLCLEQKSHERCGRGLVLFFVRVTPFVWFRRAAR